MYNLNRTFCCARNETKVKYIYITGITTKYT